MKLKNILKVIISLLGVCLLGGCGGNGAHSDIYQKGYSSGYDHGQSDVKHVKKLMDSSEYGLIDSNQFSASSAYQLWKGSLASFHFEGREEDEYRSGWIAGYNDGVDSQLEGSKRRGSSYSDSYGSNSSSKDRKTGVNFWQWCIVLVIVFMVVGYLSPDDKPSKTQKQSNSTEFNDVTENSGQSTIVVVNPWKSLLLLIFAVVFSLIMFSIFTLTESDKSFYAVDFITFMMTCFAFDNVNKYRRNIRKDFLSGFVKVLAILFMILIAFSFIGNLLMFFFG